MAVSMIGPKFYAWDRNGKPLAFGKLYTYQARTNIPKPTYQSEDQIVENTNPVILNGEGYANVYLSGSYKMVLKDKDENEIWSSDPVTSASVSEWVNCMSASYVSSTSFKVGGNQTEQFISGRRVRVDNNATEFSYATVVTSSFAAGETTVSVSGPVVLTGILEVCLSVVTQESIPERTTENIESLKKLNPPEGVIIETKGYYSNGDDGGARYLIQTLTDFGSTPDEKGDHTLDNGLIAVIQSLNAHSKQYGAYGDGVQDDFDSLQAASNTGKEVIIDSGSYLVSSPVELKAGQKVRGYNSANFASGVKVSEVFNNTVDGGCFWYTQDSSTGQKKMPDIRNVSLKADFPVKFNNEQTAIIVDGGSSNVPYGMKPFVINCDIKPRVDGVGIGVSWSKMFDGAIEDCEIEKFDIDVLLNGCDLNRVQHNRIRNGYSYHILELSASTFSSQNVIRHNDVLQAGSSSCIFIKSTARHARIYNNYLEQSGGSDGAAMVGFIDVSSVDAPSYAGNVSAGRYTAIVKDNRIDGHSKASEFIYRYEPEGQTYGEITDVGTVGGAPVFSPKSALKIVDSSNNNVDHVPYLYNQLNAAIYKFSGPRFGKWDGYQSNSEKSLSVDGKNLLMFGSGLYGNLASNFLRSKGSKIEFLNGFTSDFIIEYYSSDSEGLFSLSSTYQIIVEARCVTGSETLSFSNTLNGGGTALTNYALTNEFDTYIVEFISGSSDTDENGIFFRRTNNGNVIEIKSIKIVKKYLDEIPRTVTDSTVFTVKKPIGKVLVKADGNNTVPAYKVYEFVNGVLIESAAFATNSSIIDISVVQSGNDLTATVTGTGGGKAIKIQHQA